MVCIVARFKLVAARCQPCWPALSTAPSPASLSQMKTVLVVDDHSDTRDVLARLMRAEGYAVVTAGNRS